jgi:hypothetical protein
MAARLGNVLYWLGCIVAVGWVAVSHAEEKADDDAFILGCIWTGDHKRTVCGEFTTRASCEREGRAAVASGELSKFECISPVELAAALDALFKAWGRGIAEPTAVGPGGSDQPTFGRLPVRTAAPDRAYLQRLFPNTVPMVAGPSAPDSNYLRQLQAMGAMSAGQQPQMPYQLFHPAGTGAGGLASCKTRGLRLTSRTTAAPAVSHSSCNEPTGAAPALHVSRHVNTTNVV